MAQVFADRREAGRALAARLTVAQWHDPLVLALPRGGVPVGVEVATALAAELDVFIVRKLGFPVQPELGLGALAEGGEPILDEQLIRTLGVSRSELDEVIRGERRELARRVAAYRGSRERPRIAGRDAVLVDDGLATGSTARAGLHALQAQGARRVVLAAPVAPPDTVRSLERQGQQVVVVQAPDPFRAVGAWYRSFPQLSDGEVIDLLGASQAGTAEAGARLSAGDPD